MFNNLIVNALRYQGDISVNRALSFIFLRHFGRSKEEIKDMASRYRKGYFGDYTIKVNTIKEDYHCYKALESKLVTLNRMVVYSLGFDNMKGAYVKEIVDTEIMIVLGMVNNQACYSIIKCETKRENEYR